MWRGPSAAAAILAVCLYPDPRLLHRLISRPRPSDIALLERRLQPVAETQPAHSTLGFVTDGDPTVEHLHAAYALAPLLLEAGTRPPLILGVFRRPIEPALHLRVVRNYGDGILLLEKLP